MVGAGINVIPFMIQRHVPGIGPHVLPAFSFAALPAVLAGLAYAMLASAMPRAGGSYVYASRALSPYLGFVASFSQWFSLCVAIGVVSYVLVPFLRDIAVAVGTRLRGGRARDRDPCGWRSRSAVCGRRSCVNLRGVKAYERLIVPLMFLTFALGGVVIVAGFCVRPRRLRRGAGAREGRAVPAVDGAAADAVGPAAGVGAALRLVHRLRLDRAGRRRGAAPGTRSAAGHRHRRRVGRRCSTCCSPRRCITRCRGSTSPPRRGSAT